MRLVRIIRSHRPDSWTTRMLGEVVWTETDEPIEEVANIYGAPWMESVVLGWDVDMSRLTMPQLVKCASFMDNRVIGALFLPVECVELVRKHE